MTKELTEDNSQAEKSISYKELIHDKYLEFDIMKSEERDNIKRIKQIKLYKGKLLDLNQLADAQDVNLSMLEVVGGIEVVYETWTGEDTIDGFRELKCTNLDAEPQIFDFKDNEYISVISGKGSQFVKELNIETNFDRTLQMG